MDKTYQDLRILDWKTKEITFVIREITICKIIKEPNSFLLGYIDYKGGYHEISIPIERYKQIVID